MGADSVDSTSMETGVTREVPMGGDTDSTGWIGMVSGVACAKTAEFCDETCVKVGMMFASMDVSYIIWQSENQTMRARLKDALSHRHQSMNLCFSLRRTLAKLYGRVRIK